MYCHCVLIIKVLLIASSRNRLYLLKDISSKAMAGVSQVELPRPPGIRDWALWHTQELLSLSGVWPLLCPYVCFSGFEVTWSKLFFACLLHSSLSIDWLSLDVLAYVSHDGLLAHGGSCLTWWPGWWLISDSDEQILTRVSEIGFQNSEDRLTSVR